MAENLNPISLNSEDARPTDGDIAFACPMCGKTMVIEHDGGGEVVLCPSCDQEVIVPGGPLWDEVTAQMEHDAQLPTVPTPTRAMPHSEEEGTIDRLRAQVQVFEEQLKHNETQRASAADAIAHSLNQASRFRATLQRLEEKQRFIESEIASAKERIVAIERVL